MSSPLRTFIETVYQWDGDEKNTYKVFCTVYKPADGAQRFVPHGYKSIDEFEKAIRYWIGRGETVYTANASFRDAISIRSSGSTKLRRTVDNVSRIRILFLDVDVGGGKPYPNVAAARASLDHMVKESGFWPPTFIVESGGGIHAYWVMTEAIPYLRWHMLAEQLKACCRIYKMEADEVVTADAARILRPPESFNYKYDPPQQVMLHTTGSFYTVEQLEAALRRFGIRVVGGTQAHAKSDALPPPPRPMKGGANVNFGAGVEEPVRAGPVDVDAIAAAGCGLLADTLKDHGATHSEPLWAQLLLLATFVIDGTEVAHELSSGHPDYTEAATDQKYEAKLRAKQEHDLGWPKCSTFEACGAAQCKTCPHRAADKTPFHIVPKPKADPTQPTGKTTLPPGYMRGHGDYIIKVITAKEDEHGKTVTVTPRPFFDARITSDQAYFVVDLDVGMKDSRRDTIALPATSMSNVQEFNKFFAEHGVVWPPNMAKEGLTFMVAWRNHIADLTKASGQYVHLNKVGWTGEDFVYADKLFGKDGTKRAILTGMKLKEGYTPRGELEPWSDMVEYFATNNWVPHQAIVGTSFGSPLMEMSGVSGSAIMAFFSPQSGTGKTTSVRTAQGAWGNPRTGLLKSDDTANAINETMTVLRHLPVYWDEAALNNHALGGSHAVKMMMRASEGTGKKRLTRESNFRPQDSFAQISVITSNESLHEHIVTNENMGAVMRLLELEVPKLPMGVTATELDAMCSKLNGNYGQAGLKYAEYLGSHYRETEKRLLDWRSMLEANSKADGSERYWWSAVASILTGVEITNKIGLTRFDIRGITSYLYEGVLRMRGSATQAQAATGATFNADDFFHVFCGMGRQNFMIFTDGGVVPAGNPGKVDFSGANDRVTYVWAQYDVKNRMLRCAKRDFDAWVSKTYKHLSMKVLYADLRMRGIWDGTIARQTIGVGVAALNTSENRPTCVNFNMAALSTSPGSTPGSS